MVTLTKPLNFPRLGARAHQIGSVKPAFEADLTDFMQNYHKLLASATRADFIECMENNILPNEKKYQILFAQLKADGARGSIQFLGCMFDWILALNKSKLLATDGILQYVTQLPDETQTMGLLQSLIKGIDVVAAHWAIDEKYALLSNQLTESIQILKKPHDTLSEKFCDMLLPLKPEFTDCPLTEPESTFWLLVVDVPEQIQQQRLVMRPSRNSK